MKICKKCKIKKSISEFYKKGKYYQSHCRMCDNEISNEYYKNNKDKVINTCKKYRENNKEKVLIISKKCQKANPESVQRAKKKYRNNNRGILRIKNAKYRKKNREKLRLLNKEYYRDNIDKITDTKKKYRENYPEKVRAKQNRSNIKQRSTPRGKLNHLVSVAIQFSLKGNKNGHHWEDIVGYTNKQLMNRLVSTMPDGYDWNDFMDGKLHIDHIIPISVHNFSKAGHIDFKRCWALNNLQLLPAKENLQKHNKLKEDFQMSMAI